MIQIVQKASLYKQYFLLAVIVPSLVLLTLLASGFINYSLIQEAKQVVLEDEAEKIATMIMDDFAYVEEFSKIVVNQINDINKPTEDFISYVIDKFFLLAKINQETLTDNLFDFIMPSGTAINDSYTLSQPNLLEQASKSPGKLYIGINENGVIPLVYGVQNNQGKFLGTIFTQIVVDKLNNHIKHEVNNNINFLILTHDFNPITKINNELDIKLDIKSLNNHGILQKKLYYDKTVFSTYYILKNLPFIILVGENESLLKKEFRENIVIELIQTFIIIFIILLLFAFFKTKLIQPIIELANIANQISIGSRESHHKNYNFIEIDSLAKQLDKIKDYTEELEITKHNLEKAQKELKDVNKSLEDKVSARTFELSKALASKTDFLNNISHEVRTPIQGVTALSEGLVEHWDNFDNEKRYNLAKKVYQNSKRLFSLVSTILDLSKFNAEKIILDLTLIDLKAHILEMINECEELYLNDKNIKFNFVNYASNVITKADSDRILQLLRNLLSNSIRYSEEGVINISLINQENEIICTIEDQGIGVPEEEIDSIFEPFIQSSRTNNKAGGTGIGLAICKEIITAHGGRIWAENLPIGTRFIFSIPNAPKEDEKLLIKQNVKIDLSTSDELKTILIIDDEETCLTSLSMMLYHSNYKLITANGGIAAVDIATTFRPDLILLDLMMPDLDGFEVIKLLKQDNITH